MNINIDNLNKNSLIMQWNVDTNGNPASVRIENEVQQISTTHNLIQLAQIPDEYYGVRIGVDGEQDWLKEVDNRDEITASTYFVDYGLGYVYFDKIHKGKSTIANYYGRGVILLSDSRIFHKNGDTFVDTWDNIIERSKDAIELLESSGGLTNAIKKLDEKVAQGNTVADRIEDFISETEFYGYTILLSREAFVVKAQEDGNVKTGEYKDIYTDVIVYKGGQQINAPDLKLSLINQVNCEFEVEGQRVKLKTGSLNVNAIKGQATVVIDCGDGLVAQRIIEVTKVFDGVSQYAVDLSNSFFSFETNSDGKIENEQSVTCDINVTRANENYENYIVTIQNMPKGMTHNIVNGTKANTVTFTAVTGENLPDNGSVSVVVQMGDNTVINKTFTFSKTKRGVDAKSLILTGNQLIKYDSPDYTGVPSPFRTRIHAQMTGLSGTPIWYVLEEEETWEIVPTQSGMTFDLYYNDDSVWKGRKEVTIRCELGGHSDEITIVKIANGASGKDSYTILLTNESTTIPTDVNGEAPDNEVQKQYTNIIVYRGSSTVSPTSITIEPSEDNSYEAIVGGSRVLLKRIASEVDSVRIPINIVVDGLTFQRVWVVSKSKQGVTGESGSTLILNVDGGTRTIIYNQVNKNPQPAISSQFIARLYDNGEEVFGGVTYTWSCSGHISGFSTSKTFTPEIADTYSEQHSSNQITVVATYKGSSISYTLPVVVTKGIGGLEWVTDWDSTKVSIRDKEVLTPKLFAGTYDEVNDSITGVAIGQDVLNDGQTVGVVSYQNNVITFMLGTDGTVEIGDPYKLRTEHGLGIGYTDGQFVGRFSNLTIAGVNVPTQDDVDNSINQAVNEAQTQLKNEVNDVNQALVDLNDYVNSSLKDGIISEVEKVKIDSLMEVIKQESSDIQGQYITISTHYCLTDPFVIEALETAFNDYNEAYANVVIKYNELVNGEAMSGDDFIESISDFRNTSNYLYQVMNRALTSISETQATQITEEAKNEVIREVNDVSDALAGLEDTMNGEFKTGLIGTINLSSLYERLKQLDIEKKDVDGQYSVIVNHSALDITTKNQLVKVKSDLDSAHTTLVTRINAVIADNLLTSTELDEINTLIVTYSSTLGKYSEVAQAANISIAVNSANIAVEAITDEDVFNKVTNFGKTQGLFIENGGKVYINAQYILTRGFVAQKDDGTKTFEIDKGGNVHIVANSLTLTGKGSVATEGYVNGAIEAVTDGLINFSLSNEFQIISTNTTYYPFEADSFVVQIYGYKGSEEITNFAIGTIDTTTGIKTVVSNVNRSVTFTVSPNVSLGSTHGYIDIPITYEGKAYNKRWSWSVAKQGEQGTIVSITGEQVFKYSNNFTGTPSPNSITLTATVQNTTVSGKWQYLNGTAWLDCNVTNKTLTIAPNQYTLSSTKTLTVRYIVEEVYDTFTIIAISDGASGENGQDGADGKGISYIVEQYYHSTSMTTQTGGSWSTTVPTATRGKYIWTRSIITYTDKTTTTTTPICVSGSDGANGTNGSDGEDGVGITLVDVEYAQNTSTTTAPISGWTTTAPTWASGKYIWSRTKTTYSDGNITYTNPACITGQKGDTGASGSDAITIVLTNENHTFSADSSGNITSAQSTTTTITAYKGASTTPVVIGTLPTVSGLTLSKSGSTVTIQANVGTSLADTGTFSIPLTVDGKSFTKNFSWTKVKAGATGSTGASAKAVDIIASSMVFKSTDGGTTFSPNTITLTPKLQNLTYSNWQYSTNGGSSWTTVASGLNGLTISSGALTISKNSPLYTTSATSLSFRLNTNDSVYYDIVTIVKLYDVADIDFDQKIEDKIEDYDTLLNQQKVFNKLTNNGQTQGVYLEDNKLYINGEYIKTGTIRADLVKVQVDGKENILPFNYVTFKSGVESWLGKDETSAGIPYIETEMPIYQGGGSNSYICRKLGNSTVNLEPNTRYFFSCDVYAHVPRDGITTYGVGGSTGTGAELTLMTAESVRHIEEGRYTPIFIVQSLATQTVQNQWTHMTFEFTTPNESELYSLSNHMYIELNGSNYNVGASGYVRISNMAIEKASSGQTTASNFDYLTQIKERRIELTDGRFYKTTIGIDGLSTEEGIIEGTTSTDGYDYLINYDGMKSYKSNRERFFMGKDKSYFSYEAGSTGIISGHNDIYGVGGIAQNDTAGYRGVFIGVHNGFRIPNSEAYGRPDIYVHNGQWGMDFEEWDLLGNRKEPLGLVRRDDDMNIETNQQIKFDVGGGTDTANLWNQEQYNVTGNGQMLTYSAGRVFVSNPRTPLVLESSVVPEVIIGSNTHHLYHTGYVPKSGNWWNGGVVRVNGDGVAEVGKYLDFHATNTSTADYDVRLSVESGGLTSTGWLRASSGMESPRGFYINGYQCVARATHGGFDLGHTGSNTAILSANVPTWWNGSNSYAIFNEGFKPTNIAPMGMKDSAETGRHVYSDGVYCYNLNSKSLANGDGSTSAYGGYWSVLSWGLGHSGSAQIAVDWTSGGKGMYMRSLRDTIDNWWTWKRIPNDQWVQTSTSDIRYKEIMSDVDLDDCYSMVKNIGLHSYLLLDEEDKHTEGFDAEIEFLKATQEEGISRKLQMGVIAQEMLDYKCADFVVVQDILKDENGEILTDRYSIDAYNYASAILGGLQKEIQIRDEQYKELKQENEQLKTKVDSLEQRLEKLEAMLLGQE